MRSCVVVVCAALVSGCACPSGIGRLDPRLVSVVSSASTTEEVELRADGTGKVLKISVHHMDVARMPEAARKLAESTWPGAKVVHYETEVYEDSGMAYEVEVETAEGKRCEVSANEAGVLRYTECRMGAQDLPAAVARTLSEAVPNASIEEVEVVKGPAVDQIRVEARAGGRLHYVRIGPNGDLQGHTIKVPAVIDVPLP